MESLYLVEVQFIALGICLLFWICWVVADIQIKRFVRVKEPKIWRRFGFSPISKFLAPRTSPRDTGPSQRLSQWLKADGTKYMIEKYPTFVLRWSLCRFFEISTAAAILAFLAISIWALMSH